MGRYYALHQIARAFQTFIEVIIPPGTGYVNHHDRLIDTEAIDKPPKKGFLWTFGGLINRIWGLAVLIQAFKSILVPLLFGKQDADIKRNTTCVY